METIRCPRCQKLLRVDARSCSRCGVTIPAGKTPRRRIASDETLSQPTSPLASPHRAGHYTGLHAEDQPFQSSFFVRVQRPSVPEPEADETDASTHLDLKSDLRPDTPLPPTYQTEPPRVADYGENDEDISALVALADFPTLYPRHAPETPLPETFLPVRPRRSGRSLRVAQLMITGAVICFLLATGLLAFLLVGKGQSQAQTAQARLIALPGELRVGDVLQLAGSGFDAHHVVSLTRDTGLKLLDTQGQQMLPTTDTRGAFQVHVPITAAWTIGVHPLQASEGRIKTATTLTIQAAVAGPPHLQLAVARMDLGSGNPGTLSHENITLTNTGGGRVTWSAQSSANWLALSPTSGNFAGNTVVVLTVMRANLAPQAYLGQIIFTQDQGSAQTLYVSMTVDTTSANLVLSTASLAFGGTPAQSPAGQTMVIQNNGGQSLNWTAGSTTSDGGAWLSVTPASGLLAANTSAILTINVATLTMAVGTYQGALSFSYAGGPAQQVAITLNVTPPPLPAMHLSQTGLNFTTDQGFNPPPKSFTIANTGNAPLDWAVHADSNGQAYLAISPVSGSVPPGQSASVSVAPLLGSTNGSIQSTLTVVDSDKGTTIPNQQISVSIAITNQPVITVFTDTLDFAHASDNTDTSTLLIFTNTGSLPLNWTLVESAQVPWLSFSVTSGPLAAGDSTNIDVSCASSGMQPGTYTVTLTLKDSDAGSKVAPQSVMVTLIITA